MVKIDDQKFDFHDAVETLYYRDVVFQGLCIKKVSRHFWNRMVLRVECLVVLLRFSKSCKHHRAQRLSTDLVVGRRGNDTERARMHVSHERSSPIQTQCTLQENMPCI